MFGGRINENAKIEVKGYGYSNRQEVHNRREICTPHGMCMNAKLYNTCRKRNVGYSIDLKNQF